MVQAFRRNHRLTITESSDAEGVEHFAALFIAHFQRAIEYFD
jgi:hypothetical protein